MSQKHAAILVAFLLLAGAGTAGIIGLSAGSDNATVLDVDPETNEAPPGETVHIGVTMTSDGGYGDVGVANASVAMEYDSDVLTLESVDRGAWMEQGNETQIRTETETDEEAGYARITQIRNPHAGGATGQERFVTFTFTVDEDAPEGEYALELTGGQASLTNGWPQDVFLNGGTLVVDEDASVVDAGASDGDEANTPDESLPGFGLGVAAVALVVLVTARVLQRRN
ncbi:cohesin domain-containing protein [Natronoarchaeum sp. GCM10025321]